MSNEILMPKYPQFESIMADKGYIYTGFERPFDVYKTPNSKIRICVPCGTMVIDGARVPGRFFNEKTMLLKLNEHFNEKEKKETSA